MQRDATSTPPSVRDAVRLRVADRPRLIPARWIGILATAAAVILINTLMTCLARFADPRVDPGARSLKAR